MSWVKTEKSNYQNIASAIRTKSGSSDTFLPSEMAAAIAAIPQSSELTDCDRTGTQCKKITFTDGEATEQLSITPSNDTKFFLAICESFYVDSNDMAPAGHAFALANENGTIIASGRFGSCNAINITKTSNSFSFSLTVDEDLAMFSQWCLKTIYEIK